MPTQYVVPNANTRSENRSLLFDLRVCVCVCVRCTLCALSVCLSVRPSSKAVCKSSAGVFLPTKRNLLTVMRLNMTSQEASKLLSLIAQRSQTVILLIISKKDDVAPKVRRAVGQFGQ